MRHAYLIMAHDNFYNLEKLLRLLDHPDSDICLHINQNVADFNQGYWASMLDKANIAFAPRVRVYPYTYTQVDGIVSLLQTATRSRHDYYHMLSGADLPIKPVREIDAFFEAHRGQEFVGFSRFFPPDMVEQKHILQNYYKHPNRTLARGARAINRVGLTAQKLCRVNRMRGFQGDVKKGWDWFSITHDAALHLLAEEPSFRRHFFGCYCPSEFFLQTILYNSTFRQNIYSLDHPAAATRRFIDWERGQPYVFRLSDLASLRESPLLFARKFMETVDKEIIDAVYEMVIREDYSC
ncbi:MAG TPA: beta-1,6-N-acetylglucosaminyltransferase [Bacillota bacterium]|nr:beta-1,6-N-acetylglucosaminyltransferase [Bacillota bacterium]